MARISDKKSKLRVGFDEKKSYVSLEAAISNLHVQQAMRHGSDEGLTNNISVGQLFFFVLNITELFIKSIYNLLKVKT